MGLMRFLAMAPIVGPSASLTARPSEPVLVIVNGVGRARLAQRAGRELPRAAVTVGERGKQYTFEGVPFFAIFRSFGVPQSDALPGKAIAAYVMATGADGYRAVISNTDADPGLRCGSGVPVACIR